MAIARGAGRSAFTHRIRKVSATSNPDRADRLPRARHELLADLALLLLALLLTGCVSRRVTSSRQAPPAGTAFLSATGARWTGVSQAAGLRFRHFNGATGRKYMPETMGSGGAFFDFDGDGWLDLFLVNSRSLDEGRPGVGEAGLGSPGGTAPAPPRGMEPLPRLLRNRHDGTFADVTANSGLDRPLYGMGCAAADYDGDGRVDLFVTTCLDGDRLYRNLGGGKFRDVTAAVGLGDRRWGTSCAWVDYNRDGFPDLFVCRYVRYQLGASDRDCFGPDGKRMYCDPRHLPPDTCSLYRNEGGRRFRDVSAAAGIAAKPGKALGVAIGDVDGDDWPDLLVANDTLPNFLFHNVAGGPDRRFEEIGLEAGVAMPESGEPRAGMGIDLGDLENDGRLSLLVSNFSGEGLALYQQDRARSLLFTERAYEAGIGPESLNLLGFGLLLFDYDNDTRLDLFVANGHIQPEVHERSTELTYGERNLLFHNLGGGRFEEVGRVAGGPFAYEEVSRGAAFGDFDNDGDLDLLVTNNGGPAELLRNDGGNRAHWLQLRLLGRGPNTGALGAVATVRTGDRIQRQMVRTGSSYLSQSMTRLHFGLGIQTRVNSLAVRWPDGRMSRLRDLPADRLLTLREPNG
jgi:hypothetical protein